MKNLCIFINILQDRADSERDSNLAVRVFSKLNYQIEIYHDVSSRELALVLEKARSLVCSADLPYDSLTVFVGAHGSAEGLVMRDGVRVCVEEIVSHFMPCSCPALVGKPKLFFFQNCREFQYTHSVSRERNIEQMVESAGDMMVALSTRKGCPSLRCEQGTLFFQAVLHQIESAGVSHAPLSTLLSEVVERVKHESVLLSNKCQMPQIVTSLTRQFYFNPPPIINTEPFNYSSFYSCFHCSYSHNPTVPCYPLAKVPHSTFHTSNYSSHMTYHVAPTHTTLPSVQISSIPTVPFNYYSYIS